MILTIPATYRATWDIRYDGAAGHWVADARSTVASFTAATLSDLLHELRCVVDDDMLARLLAERQRALASITDTTTENAA